MKNFKKLIKEALTPHYLRESVNDSEFPKFFTVKDTLHYTPEIDGKPKKLLKGTYFLRNAQGDTAVYFNQAFKSEVEIDNDDIFNFKRLKIFWCLNEIKTHFEYLDVSLISF